MVVSNKQTNYKQLLYIYISKLSLCIILLSRRIEKVKKKQGQKKKTPLTMNTDNKELDTEKGINLAIDPNLITLPLDGSANTQANSNTTETGIDPDPSSNEASTVKPSRSLINNPYEIYGQMPLAHLIPLILQQRKIPFSQLSEDDIMNSLKNELENRSMIQEDSKDIKMEHEQDEGTIGSDQLNFSGLQNEDIAMGGVNDSIIQNTISRDNSSNDAVVDNNNNNTNKTNIDELPSNMMKLSDFNKVRSSMLEQTNIALNESSLALETVSLLLSATRENNAKATISPFLKSTVPLGSLNSDVVPEDPQNVNEDLLFNIGWKLKCLNDSKQILKDTVDKLKIDLMKEHTYWRKIGKYISNNDVLFKMRDKTTGLRSLAIKYGFEDSGSDYDRDRGIAILRNNMANNMLELVPLSHNNKYSNSVSNMKILSNDNKTVETTFLKVRIYTKIESEDDYILSGESSPMTLNEFKEIDHEIEDPTIIKQENIREQIQNLKDMIFEKELIYQLKKECSILISYGVTIENENKILIELPNERFEIELIHRDDIIMSNHERDAPKINDKRANLVLVLLRMLLTVHFKKNLRDRYGILKNGLKRNVNDILLIRPILSKLRHQIYKKLLKKIIKDNVMDFLPETTTTVVEMDRTRVTKDVSSVNGGVNQHQIPKIDRHITRLNKEIAVFDRLLNPPSSDYIIENSKGDILKINLSLPNYCTAKITIQYESSNNNNSKNTDSTINGSNSLLLSDGTGETMNTNQRVLFHSEFSEFKEVEEFLHFIVAEYMIERKESI